MTMATTGARRRGRQASAEWEPKLMRSRESSLLPSDPASEEALLGSLIIDDDRFPEAAQIVQASHFHGPGRAAVFAAMMAVRHGGGRIDNVTVRSALEAAGEPPPTTGWAAELTRLMEQVPTATHVVHYAETVRRKADQRRMIAAAGEIARLGHDGADDALDQARAILAAMDADSSRAESGTIDDALSDLLAPRPDGWSTGVGVLDQWLGDVGLVPGRVLTLSGKSGVGKTWLACMATMSALEAGARVAFFTLEMTRAEVLVRLAASRLGGRTLRLLRASTRWTDADRETFREMVALFDGKDISVYQSTSSPFDIAVKARRTSADVVVVDWYQQLDDRWAIDQTADQVDRTHSLALLDLAIRGNACVVVVSQLNKDGSMKYGAWLNAYSAAHLTLSNDADAESTVILKPEKNRWGVDSAGGCEARFFMDKSRGSLTPLVADPAGAGKGAPKSKPASPAAPRQWQEEASW